MVPVFRLMSGAGRASLRHVHAARYYTEGFMPASIGSSSSASTSSCSSSSRRFFSSKNDTNADEQALQAGHMKEKKIAENYDDDGYFARLIVERPSPRQWNSVDDPSHDNVRRVMLKSLIEDPGTSGRDLLGMRRMVTPQKPTGGAAVRDARNWVEEQGDEEGDLLSGSSVRKDNWALKKKKTHGTGKREFSTFLTGGRRAFSSASSWDASTASSQSDGSAGGSTNSGMPNVTMAPGCIKKLNELQAAASKAASATSAGANGVDDLQNQRCLRFTVASGGCSGYQYEFKMDTMDTYEEENDLLIEQEGARLVIDRLSLTFLEDCEIDYVTEMIRSSFQVTKNKLADANCGCGASFSVTSEF